MLLAVDVHYRTDSAKAVCLGFEQWTDAEPTSVHEAQIPQVEDYVPGEFYKRELPCLLQVLPDERLTDATCIIVDGYVVLDDDARPGLGHHLYTALSQSVPVIGVAKTSFAHNTRHVREVRRGTSQNPLYITAVGIPLENATDHIRSMHGPHRLPTLLKHLDRLTKS